MKYPLEAQFDFDRFYYEIVSNEVKNNNPFSRKKTDTFYYIRRCPICRENFHETLTHWLSLGYQFMVVKPHERSTIYWSVKYWNTKAEPEKLLMDMKNEFEKRKREMIPQDFVVFSTKDL